MIEKVMINNKWQQESDPVTFHSSMPMIIPSDIKDAFYYWQDVPVVKHKLFKQDIVSVEKLQYLVIRFNNEGSKSIAIMNDKDLYKKLINALIVDSSIRTKQNMTNFNDYEIKCYSLEKEFARVPSWITDESRIYFLDNSYPVSSLRDALECVDETDIIELEDETQENIEVEERVDIGVETVDYVLKWLEPKGIINVAKDCLWKNGYCIRLNNPEYIDDPQEFDHIVIMSNCVIMIETKNYKGKINIDKYGNWSRELDGEIKGIRNPKQQIERHVDLLKSILPSNVTILGVLCLSHPEVLITGSENTDVDIVRSDLLSDYILTMKDKYGDVIDIESKKNELLELINSYKVSE